MRKGFLRSVAALLVGSGLAVAQAPPPKLTADSAEPPRLAVEKLQVPTAPPTVTAASPQPEKPAEKIGAPKKPAEGTTAPAGKPTGSSAKECPPLCDPCLPACCEVCGPPGRCWVSVEYLLWWIRTDPVPPLLTTSPESSLGILGQPGTTTLIGGRGLDRDPLHGARFTAGFWLDCCHTKGIEFTYFFLANRSTELSGGGPGTPGSATTARPFFDVLTGRENSQLVSFPGVLAGVAEVRATNRLQGIAPNVICNLCCCNPKDCCDPHGYRVDLLVGPRYYHLEEDITIRENLNVAPTVPVLGGSNIRIRDSFDTENRFYGGFIGARAEAWMNRVFVNATGGIALGVNQQAVTINGNTVITPPTGAVVNRSGGLLTQDSNIGRYTRDEFAVAPEFNFNVGYQVTQQLRAYVGYSVIYWTDVLRPGAQIDRGLNTTQLPTLGGPGVVSGPCRPAFLFNDSDFWAQGLNVGVQLRY